MTLRATTVRLSVRLHRLVAEAAREEGVTVSQFIRDSVLVRLTYMRATKDPGLIRDIERTLRDLWDESR